MKQKFNVTGMTCSACSAHVEKAVSRLDGVQKAEVSLMTNSMTVSGRQSRLSGNSPRCSEFVPRSRRGRSAPLMGGAGGHTMR